MAGRSAGETGAPPLSVGLPMAATHVGGNTQSPCCCATAAQTCPIGANACSKIASSANTAANLRVRSRAGVKLMP